MARQQPNTVLNVEKLKAISSKSGMTQGYPLPPLFPNTDLEALAGIKRQGKEIKGI